MKIKKNILTATLLISGMTLGGFSHAAWLDNILPVEALSSINSCSNVSKIYLNQDNDADSIPDLYLYLNSNFILNGTANSVTAGQILREAAGIVYTKVKYYTPLSNMISKMDSNNITGALDNSTFWRASRVFPYNTPVRGIATTPNKVVFEQPSDNDPTKKIISIIYDYKYKYATALDGNTNSAYRYNSIPNMSYMLNTGLTYITTLPGSNGNKKRAWSAVQPSLANTAICTNYEMHRCGDSVQDISSNGYLNAFTGETCDEGSLNGTPGHCPTGCGLATSNERCGDNTTQPSGTPYNGDANNISFEECDDGDLAGDNGDGLLNGDDAAASFCSTICLPTFAEEFSEVFVN